MDFPQEQPVAADDNLINLSVSFATDGVFLRRTCPSCGLDFKTETPPDQFSGMLVPAIQRAGTEYGLHLTVNGQETSAATALLTCPYCDVQSPLQDTLTSEAASYLQRIAMRELILPQLRSMFAGLEDVRGGFVNISFTQTNSTLPPRPIHGPEPSDLSEIVFLCCGERAKVLEGWSDVLACPKCGTSCQVV